MKQNKLNQKKAGQQLNNNVFEDMAKRYDTPERIKLANIISKEINEQLTNGQSKRVIDYGSGTGLISVQLADQVSELIMIDSSEEMLKVADEKIKQNKLDNTKTLLADFTEKVPDIKADVVMMSLVLLHIPETKKILERVYSVLNEDGKLIIVDFDYNEKVSHPKIHNGFKHDELTALLSDVGFQTSEVRNFHHGKETFMNQDADVFISVSRK